MTHARRCGRSAGAARRKPGIPAIPASLGPHPAGRSGGQVVTSVAAARGRLSRLAALTTATTMLIAPLVLSDPAAAQPAVSGSHGPSRSVPAPTPPGALPISPVPNRTAPTDPTTPRVVATNDGTTTGVDQPRSLDPSGFVAAALGFVVTGLAFGAYELKQRRAARRSGIAGPTPRMDDDPGDALENA